MPLNPRCVGGPKLPEIAQNRIERSTPMTTDWTALGSGSGFYFKRAFEKSIAS